MIEGLKPYPVMKDSGVPWLAVMPDHWEIRRNGRLFGLRKQLGFPELPILEVSIRSGVRHRDIEDSGRKQAMADRSQYQRAIKGDIAYNMMRMWQGAVGVVPQDGLVSPAYIVARPFLEVDAAYYAYLFRTVAYMREIDVFSRGIVPDRNRLYWESFKQMPSPYPPLDEQRLIARFLDWYGAKTSKLIRSNYGLVRLVAEQRQALTHEIIQSDGTRNLRLALAVNSVFREVSRDAQSSYTPIGLFNRGRGIFHKAAANGSNLGDSTFSWVAEGDLVLSGQFAWEGAVSLASYEDAGCIASHRYHILRSKPEIVNAEYLLSFFRSSLGHLILNEHSRGAAGRNRPLNVNTLLKEDIPVPTLSAQKRLSELVLLETRLGIAVARFSERLRENYACVSAHVVTGKLDVRAAAAALPEATEPAAPEAIEASEQVEAEEDASAEDLAAEEAAA